MVWNGYFRANILSFRLRPLSASCSITDILSVPLLRTTGSEFCCHHLISKALAQRGKQAGNLVFIADSYSSWQKGAIENVDKLILQYISKETDFSNLSDAFIRKIQHKINHRPRKKLSFSSPKNVFFRQIANFALAS